MATISVHSWAQKRNNGVATRQAAASFLQLEIVHPPPTELPRQHVDSRFSEDEDEQDNALIDNSEQSHHEKLSSKIYKACLFDINWNQLHYKGLFFPGIID